MPVLNRLITLLLIILPSCSSTNERVTAFPDADRVIAGHSYEGCLKGDDFPCGPFREPCGLTIDLENRLYIVDKGNHRICVFDENGQYISEFGNFGSEKNQFHLPEDIAIDKNVLLYIVDSGNNRIEKYNYEGAYLGTFYQDENLTFESLTQIAIDNIGLIYVTDKQNDRILQINAFGELTGIIGNYGQAQGQYNLPCGIWISPVHEVYIADTNNRRIQVFNSIGNYQRTITLTPADHQIKPVAISGDRYRHLFVLTNEMQVLALELDGSISQKIDLFHDRADNLSGDLLVNRTGKMFVADPLDNCIHIIQMHYAE